MSIMLPRRVLILGANGRFGRSAVQAFTNAGWDVIAQSRVSSRHMLPAGATALACDALDTQRIIDACDGIEVAINALNPPYTAWDKLVVPLSESALAIAQATGALLMLPGNVYNFGRQLPEVLTEQTPQVANTSKAALRIAQENRMRQAAGASGSNAVQSVVIRAGDFIGGSGLGTWLDLVIGKKLSQGIVTYPGPMDVPHAWAYLPDLAWVFVAVAQRRACLPAFSTLHFAGATLTGSDLYAALERVHGRALRRKKLPWWLLHLAAPFAPMLRAIVEMRYLWQRSHRLDESRLVQLIGTVPHTPIDQALRETLSGNPAWQVQGLAGSHMPALKSFPAGEIRRKG